MKPKLMKLTALAFVLGIFGGIAPNFCRAQTDKDRQELEKLERDLRKDINKEIAKFKPFKEKVPIKENVTVPMQEPSLKVKSTYDKFKDETTVSIAMPLYHRLSAPLTGPVGQLGFIGDIDVYAIYTYSGQDPVKPNSIYLAFESTAGTTAFGTDPSLIFLADDKRLKMGNMIQKVRGYGTLLKETETAEIPYETFATLANADTVEVQVGHIEFPFSEFHLRGFRMLAGLPTKEAQIVPKIKPATISNLNSSSVGGTLWRGKDLSASFKDGGEVVFEGLLARNGTWRQTNDRVELELPGGGFGAVRGIGIGIIKGNKMAVKIRFFGVFGASITQVMEFTS